MGVGDCSFHHIVDVVSEGGIEISKYKSQLTGMTVCIARADGPLVAGYLCIPTEAHDDDGLPHTLEHLVFMGSESYPYKGVLDLLANRCLASGTNAWTDTDHTCYTMSTAGHEGFLNLLPIYIDHVLFPTLSESAFVTEVHHINGEGEDAGVVYCEMQARENTGESRCHLAMLRAMYPGHCGYKSETGGLMKNLRESTTNEKVRAYHKQFYRAENLCVIIVGQIDPQQVFHSLKPAEDRIIMESKDPFTKAWQTPVPLLTESAVIRVPYPCDEDKHGIFLAAWRGPNASDVIGLLAVQILLEYLTDTSVAPLQKEFVENESPYCNNVEHSIIENSVSCLQLKFTNVPVEKLSSLKDRLFDILSKYANGTEHIDMERMATSIQKRRLNILSMMESGPHDLLALMMIADFLYGTTNENLQQRVKQTELISALSGNNMKFWSDLIKKYFIDGKHVVVLGHPSPVLSEEMSQQEKDRVSNQQKLLGVEGLKEKEFILNLAMEANEVEPPLQMLKSVPVPSVQSIKFFTINRFCNFRVISSAENDMSSILQKMPCRFQLDDIQSLFLRMDVLIDTNHVPEEFRLYLPLFVELITESAMNPSGEHIPYEEVVRQLMVDTVSYSTTLGRGCCRFYCQSFAQVLSLSFMIEEEKYALGISWLRNVLFYSIFEASRIKTIANKMLSDVSQMKRSGSFTVKTMMRSLCFGRESNHWAACMFRQQVFLNQILETLNSEPEKIISALNELRSLLTADDKITVHLSGNIKSLQKKTELESTWVKNFLPGVEKSVFVRDSIRQCHELVHKDFSVPSHGLITGVGSVESCYLLQTTTSITSYNHPDYAPLLVLIQYLTQLEGPMWKQIRGLGLSYNYAIFLQPNEGLLYFILYKSTSLVKAYNEGRTIVENHLNGTTKWDLSLLESACSSLMYEIIEKQKTVADATEQSLTSYFKNIDPVDYTKTLLKTIANVTTSDMNRVGSQYLKPLFCAETSRCAICCHPSKVDDIVQGFKKMSRDLKVISCLEESFMSAF